MEISNMPNKQFKLMVIKILDLRVDELNKHFNKEIENTKKNQSELKITKTGGNQWQIKGCKRMDQYSRRQSHGKNPTQIAKRKENFLKNEDRLKDFLDNNK